MLTFVSNLLQGLLLFLLLVAGVLFKLTARSIRSPTKDEPQRVAMMRLWKAYRVNVVRTLASPWSWGAAGLATAALIYFNLP